MDLIKKYFSELHPEQIKRFEQLYLLYENWNSKINLISRRDFPFFYERHVLHSLAVAKFFQFPEGSLILDAGTGGGFPGIPLAIYFPEIRFHLVDSIRKKTKAVEAIASDLALANISVECNRIENLGSQYDYIVSRAVAPLQDMIRWTKGKLATGGKSCPKPGIIYLKGGDIQDELNHIKIRYRIFRLSDCFSEEFFATKLIVYILTERANRERFKY